MEDINSSLETFIESVERKEDINVVNNNLSLLVAQLNIFYYKNNFFNNISNCNETAPNLSMQYLESVSQQIKDIYPKYMDLKNDQYENIYIRNLKCDKTNSDYTKNIDKTNKIHDIINDITELLEFNQNYKENNTPVAPVAPVAPVVAPVVVQETVNPGPIISPPVQESVENTNKNYKTLIIIFVILGLILVIGIIIYIYIKYRERIKLMNKNMVPATTVATPATTVATPAATNNIDTV